MTSVKSTYQAHRITPVGFEANARTQDFGKGGGFMYKNAMDILPKAYWSRSRSMSKGKRYTYQSDPRRGSDGERRTAHANSLICAIEQ